jgi:hypothetical protein
MAIGMSLSTRPRSRRADDEQPVSRESVLAFLEAAREAGQSRAELPCDFPRGKDGLKRRRRQGGARRT